MDLVENTSTKKKYALKRITCHSVDDQKIAMQEINYYKKLRHPNIMELVDSTFKGIVEAFLTCCTLTIMFAFTNRFG